MKKSLSLLFALLLLFACGCSANRQPAKNEDSAASPSPEILTEPPAKSEPTDHSSPADNIAVYYLPEEEFTFPASPVIYDWSSGFLYGEDLFNDFLIKAENGEKCAIELTFRADSMGYGVSPYAELLPYTVHWSVHFIDDVFFVSYARSDAGNWTVTDSTYRKIISNDGLYTNYGGDMEKAKQDGCVILNIQASDAGAIHYAEKNISCIQGEENWDSFLERTRAGKADSIRIAICAQSCVAKVFDIVYDGSSYYHRTYSETSFLIGDDEADGWELTTRYDYLNEFENDMTFNEYIYFALMHEECSLLSQVTGTKENSFEPIFSEPVFAKETVSK